ncbi:hypothetical protein RCIA47 [Methanocella arvoryzae MRE50]|uniref:Uncharacterized protein n=1 Tax=Methanocella arvoryzae (strain DSM 22066 / NBRC 105507 / MRE50) TaxID=351160 RepID=Q0W5X5_METAR|nr:hypothetical protein RCIA47 [Methanocella arvoryzae MRE50]
MSCHQAGCGDGRVMDDCPWQSSPTKWRRLGLAKQRKPAAAKRQPGFRCEGASPARTSEHPKSRSRTTRRVGRRLAKEFIEL